MQIVILVGGMLLVVVHLLGIYLCAITFANIEAEETPISMAIILIPVLNWYYVFKYLDGGWRNWLKDFKKAINEHKELD